MKPHEVLGVEPGADEKTVKAAYRKLVKQYHPDHNKEPDAAAKFQEVQNAYEAMTSKKNTQTFQYDTQDHSDYDIGDFADVLDSFFAARDGFYGFDARMNRVNANIQKTVGVPVTMLYDGGEIKVSYVQENYDDKGRVQRLPGVKTITIKPGTKAGERIVFPGEGRNPNPKTPKADLIVVIIPVSTPEFHVADFRNLRFHRTVNMFDAVLGTKLEIPTPDKRTVSLTVPPGVQNGTVLRMRGQGIHAVDERGHIDVLIEVQTPRLNDDQRAILKKAYDEINSA